MIWFAIVKGIEQWGEPTEVEEKCGPPEQMTGNAVEFNGDDPDVLSPFGHLDAGGFFHRQGPAMVEGKRMEIIHARRYWA